MQTEGSVLIILRVHIRAYVVSWIEAYLVWGEECTYCCNHLTHHPQQPFLLASVIVPLKCMIFYYVRWVRAGIARLRSKKKGERKSRVQESKANVGYIRNAGSGTSLSTFCMLFSLFVYKFPSFTNFVKANTSTAAAAAAHYYQTADRYALLLLVDIPRKL